MNQLSPLTGDSELFSEKSLSGCGSKRHDQVRFDCSDFRIEPGFAGLYLPFFRLFVNASLALSLPFEVLNYIGHVDPATIDAGFSQRLVEQFACRAHKRAALEILVVAWLLADEHDRGARRALAKYSLRCIFPQGTRFAPGRGLT